MCSVLCVMELEHEYNEQIYKDIYRQERCVYQKHKQDLFSKWRLSCSN